MQFISRVMRPRTAKPKRPTLWLTFSSLSLSNYLLIIIIIIFNFRSCKCVLCCANPLIYFSHMYIHISGGGWLTTLQTFYTVWMCSNKVVKSQWVRYTPTKHWLYFNLKLIKVLVITIYSGIIFFASMAGVSQNALQDNRNVVVSDCLSARVLFCARVKWALFHCASKDHNCRRQIILSATALGGRCMWQNWIYMPKVQFAYP